MTKANREEERRLCREFYEKWPFIKRIVELYAEAVSWRGLKVTTPRDPNKVPEQYSQVIDVDSLKNGVRNMLVDGVGNFHLRVIDSEHELTIPRPAESPLPEDKPGRSFLWTATLTGKDLENLLSLRGKVPPNAEQMLQVLIDIMYDSMHAALYVPRWLLLPNASTAQPALIRYSLAVFGAEVQHLRKHVSFQIKKYANPLIAEALDYQGPIEADWNEDWLPQHIECGPVYQVFKAQGIELTTLREEALNTAKFRFDNSLISKETYEEEIKWFL